MSLNSFHMYRLYLLWIQKEILFIKHGEQCDNPSHLQSVTLIENIYYSKNKTRSKEGNTKEANNHSLKFAEHSGTAQLTTKIYIQLNNLSTMGTVNKFKFPISIFIIQNKEFPVAREAWQPNTNKI